MSSNQNTNSSGFYNLRKTIQKKICKSIQLTTESSKKENFSVNQKTITNPYEVIREQKKVKTPKYRPIENFVFSNPALDIHCDKPTLQTIEGDFEIMRKVGKNKQFAEKGCFENAALEIPSTAIVLPFKPNVGMQIKFETPACNKSTNNLKNEAHQSPFSVEKELEYFENQWENSINETKNARSIKNSENMTPSSLHKVKSGKITPLKQNLKKLNLRTASKMLTYSKETAV